MYYLCLMTNKEYNKIKKSLRKVEKVMGYKQGSLLKTLNIPKPNNVVPKVVNNPYEDRRRFKFPPTAMIL